MKRICVPAVAWEWLPSYHEIVLRFILPGPIHQHMPICQFLTIQPFRIYLVEGGEPVSKQDLCHFNTV